MIVVAANININELDTNAIDINFQGRLLKKKKKKKKKRQLLLENVLCVSVYIVSCNDFLSYT